ncbi:MAG: OmpA family protein [Bacteroidota bacterium]
MNAKALLTLLLSVLWIFGGSWLYNKYFAADWCSQTAVTTPPPVINKAKDPLMFKWSDPATFTYEKFPTFQSEIVSGNQEGRILEITGRYFEGETAPAGYDNMGMARAEQIRKLFPEIPNTRIRLKSELVAERDGVKTEEFTSAAFNWVDAPKEERKVIELGKNEALVYFDFNATRKKVDKDVDDFLKKVAERLKSTQEKVEITGHTDNVGNDAANLKLGERRAKTVRDILIRYGVPRARITTFSKGETQPEESNDTDAGRALNRRAVVKIVP